MIAKEQFKGISLWGFQDRYEFPISTNSPDLEKKIIEFYLTRKAKPVNSDKLSFVRGKKFWTWFNLGSEFLPYQTITVSFSNDRIEILYVIHGGFWLRFPPYQLEKEIIELQQKIGT